MKCKKCKSGTKKEGTFVVEGGNLIYLCNFCSTLFAKLPTNMLSIFMCSNSHSLKEVNSRLTPVEVSMLEARERRALGLSKSTIEENV